MAEKLTIFLAIYLKKNQVICFNQKTDSSSLRNLLERSANIYSFDRTCHNQDSIMLAFSRPEKRLNDFLVGVCYVVQYRLVADKSKHPGLYTFDSFRETTTFIYYYLYLISLIHVYILVSEIACTWCNEMQFQIPIKAQRIYQPELPILGKYLLTSQDLRHVYVHVLSIFAIFKSLIQVEPFISNNYGYLSALDQEYSWFQGIFIQLKTPEISLEKLR